MSRYRSAAEWARCEPARRPDDYDAELYWVESQRGEHAEGRYFDPTDDEPEEEEDGSELPY